MAIASDRRSRAIAAFRAANAQDPHRLLDAGVERPKELVAAERLAAWVERLEPAASEALTLASHCQHLCRWEVPRSDFPDGRIGYLTWRKSLARRHADRAGEILRDAGYDDALIAEVRAINLKQGLHANPDTQTMEDALCLSFLEHELDEFAAKHEDDKVVDIIQKTWRKMSERGHARALELAPALPSRAGELVRRALSGG
ncbi:MAG TPA: DUF4202 domain-containing protein [Polyangiaceae bacterium]|nr:DUF4202 domain-containing protein [Polyangiaceae bacterium]